MRVLKYNLLSLRHMLSCLILLVFMRKVSLKMQEACSWMQYTFCFYRCWFLFVISSSTLSSCVTEAVAYTVTKLELISFIKFTVVFLCRRGFCLEPHIAEFSSSANKTPNLKKDKWSSDSLDINERFLFWMKAMLLMYILSIPYHFIDKTVLEYISN